MLKLRLIFIEFRNLFVITQIFPDISQFNPFVGINIIAQCYTNYWDILSALSYIIFMIVQYLTVHIGVSSTQYNWAVNYGSNAPIFYITSFSFMNHRIPYIYLNAAWYTLHWMEQYLCLSEKFGENRSRPLNFRRIWIF